jgi:hypothetical protein
MKWGVLILILVMGLSCATAGIDRTMASHPAVDQGHLESYSGKEGEEIGGRKVTYRASVTLEAHDIQGVQKTIHELVLGMGGFITTSSSNYLLLRIPAGELEKFIDTLGELAKIIHQEISGQDITDYYSDLELQEESLTRLRERYLAILERAEDVEDLLRIEKELERVNREIEGIRGSLIMANQQLAFSTVTITFEEPSSPGPLGWIFVGLFEGVKWLFVWD